MLSERRPHASLYENIGRTHGFEPLRVDGQLPEGLAGTMYRCGPGQIERFGHRLSHPFEADGVVMAVRLDGRGGAMGAARVIEGAGYLEEQAAGRYLYGTGAPWPRRVINSLRGRVKNTGNTRAWSWRGRVFAVMEACKPIELDPETLEVLGERDLDGAVVRSFSAHPHRVARLATSFNFGLRYGKQTMLDLYALPDEGPTQLLGSYECSWAGLVHDFVVTERHAIFVSCPAKLKLARALFQLGSLSSWFEWAPALGCEIIVVPLANPGAPKRFNVDAFWVWHFVNAFERGDELVIDYCRYPDLSSLTSLGDGSKIDPPKLHRGCLNLRTGAWRSEQRWHSSCEFPRVDPRVEGQAHPHAWFYARDEADGFSLARVDAESGDADVWALGPEIKPSEPVPVRHSEDPSVEPWILSLCHDEASDLSFVAVLDGGALADGPVAKLWFDQSLPDTFHGDWVAG
ncbi:carotenoid oxygenase family protein [Enhygromyxa salina]|uniref:Apocarotenoid-15,15'-oxygenase n=1 Tax=Enhygromyxa salina TaxID=215803 RepID=A0A2S9YYD0_9BACT|nr:carotenoid oxygenase family protein [Enhygromyxa salina]PRQ10069.1 Apocarotenoid-15,15'-oxygenase [Enhygromyxa salina]